MDMTLSKEHQMVRQLFHEFAVKELEPWAEETDEKHRFPWENVRKMQSNGFMGIPFPRELGGQGCDTLAYILAVEEFAKVCATTSVILSAHTSLERDLSRVFYLILFGNIKSLLIEHIPMSSDFV